MILLFILASRKACFVLVVVVDLCFSTVVLGDDIVVHPGIQESLFIYLSTYCLLSR